MVFNRWAHLESVSDLSFEHDLLVLTKLIFTNHYNVSLLSAGYFAIFLPVASSVLRLPTYRQTFYRWINAIIYAYVNCGERDCHFQTTNPEFHKSRLMPFMFPNPDLTLDLLSNPMASLDYMGYARQIRGFRIGFLLLCFCFDCFQSMTVAQLLTPPYKITLNIS